MHSCMGVGEGHMCVLDLKGEMSLSEERKLKMRGKRQRKSRGDILEEECTPLQLHYLLV